MHKFYIYRHRLCQVPVKDKVALVVPLSDTSAGTVAP